MKTTSLHRLPDKVAGARARLMVLGLILFASVAAAQTGAQKIGVVDMDSITRRSRTIQDAVKKAEAQVQREQDKVDVKVRELRQLKENLRARRSVLSETEAGKQEDQILKLQDELDDLQYQVNKQLSAVQKEVMDPEVDRIIRTVREIAKREGYTMVIRAEAVLFSEDSADLTPLVIQALDRQDRDRSSAPAPAGSRPRADEATQANDSRK